MLQALGKNVIIEAIEEQLTGKIILNNTPKPTRYKIVNVGDEVTRVAAEDIVVIENYCIRRIENGKEIILMALEENINIKVV